MDSQDLVVLLAAGERRAVEFKGPRDRRNKHKLHEVVRAVLGLTNHRDGGMVILGVSNSGEPVGLTPQEVDSWANRDELRPVLAPFADPWIDVRPEIVSVNVAA